MTTMTSRPPRRLLWALLGALVLVPDLAMAADHRDGPRVTDTAAILGALDLNDLYLFVSPANRNNVVGILTTGGAGVGVVTPPFFFPGAVYEYRISNDGNPVTDEIILQIVFSQPDARLRQQYTVTSLNAAGQGRVIATGVTNGRPANLRGGGRITAGLFDDPFFFDANAFNMFRARAQANASVANRVAPFLPPSIPNNFFGNFNVLAIVLEVPRGRLQSGRNNPNITVWNRVLADAGDGRGFAQFDRQAIPALNTVLNFPLPNATPPRPSLQDQFNTLTPADDIGLRTEAAQRMTLIFGTSPTTATNLVNLLLPDVASLNTTSTAGFPNGRRLQDDVIDAEISLLTEGALPGDRVVNDSFFRRQFPYLGTPLPVTRVLNAARALSASSAGDGEPIDD